MRRLAWPLLIFVLSLASLVGSPRVHAQATGITRSYHAGWNLVALPSGTGFSGIQAAYTLQPGDTDYEPIGASQGSSTGFGYWAYFAGSLSELLGTGSGSPYSVTTPAGQYIMLGDPSGASSATVSGADVVYAYEPTNGYQPATTLLPGQSAWAMVANGGTITVTPQAGATPAQATASAPPPQSTVLLPTTFTLNGTLTASDCGDGYNLPNAAVTVRNENNTIIATTVAVPDAKTQALLDQLASIQAQLDADNAEINNIYTQYLPSTVPVNSPGWNRIFNQLLPQIGTLSGQIATLKAHNSGCTVLFSTIVPLAQYYQIRAGTHDGPAYSFKELRAMNFSLDLSLK